VIAFGAVGPPPQAANVVALRATAASSFMIAPPLKWHTLAASATKQCKRLAAQRMGCYREIRAEKR
jgi:hypothetical protein